MIMVSARNNPCPCGSGKKYKHCCEASAATHPAPVDFGQLAFLYNNGRFPEAEQFARTLLNRHPGSGEIWKALGYSLGKQGKESVAALQKAASLLPADAGVQDELANALNAKGLYREALECYRKTLSTAPGNALTHNNLATVLQEIGQTEEAVTHYQMALSIQPDYVDAHYNLAIALKKMGRLDDAVSSYRNALRLDPSDADAHYNLGIALQARGELKLAIQSYRDALRIKPAYVDARNNLGMALCGIGELDDAIGCFQQILEIQPNHPEACCNLGVALMNAGLLKEAIVCYQRALIVAPDMMEAHRGYLFARLYNDSFTLEELFGTISGYAARRRATLNKPSRQYQDQSGHLKRKIRVGYVSSDFRNHPVGRNILPVIEMHDRDNFEIYLYADLKKPDGMTEQFRKSESTWRPIMGMTDQAVAEMIRQDKMDILVLLAGHFDENRPQVAACRAAPVRVSFHDPMTSGLREMDYLLTDHGLSPRDTREQFTERLFHLPTFYLHPPMINAPDVGALPALERGHVTFCSFNNPSKINDKVVAAWAKVLHAVTDSHLVLKYKNIFSNSCVQRRFIELFQAQGVQADRLQFIGVDEPGEQHLARYAEVDIALDTFPFTGSTTTFEALWMGVPVITLMGDHMVARWSGAMMRKLHLDELIANTEDEFVSVACRLANDLERLAALRAGLRDRVSRSPLCDEHRRTRQIERAYRWMWAKHCAQNVR